jgi:hypothetical protein
MPPFVGEQITSTIEVPRMLGKVKTHAEERLRMYLMKRHKVKNRRMSTGRFPSRQLYVNMDFTRFRQQLAGKWRKPQ